MSSDPLLLAAIRAAAHAPSPEAALDELLEIGLRLTGAGRAAAFLWDADRGGLAVGAARGWPADDLPDFEAAASHPDHPVQLAATERLQTSGSLPGDDPMTLSAWPIVIGRDGIEEPVGALAIAGSEPITPAGADRVAALADLVGLAVDRARLGGEAAERGEWTERIANSDLLTGLANARTLGRVLELEVARAARGGSSLSVAVFDVDGLGTVNEADGRKAGDDVLREVAAILGEAVRYVDTVGRWGPDEFVLVAPGATGSTVVRRVVEGVAARALGGNRVTVSAGLATFPADGTTGEELLAAATAALRAAQSVGPGTFAEATREAETTGSGGNGPRA